MIDEYKTNRKEITLEMKVDNACSQNPNI